MSEQNKISHCHTTDAHHKFASENPSCERKIGRFILKYGFLMAGIIAGLWVYDNLGKVKVNSYSESIIIYKSS